MRSFAVVLILLASAVLCVARSTSALALVAVVDASAPAALPGSDDALDRQTPRRTMEGFLKEAREGDFRVAADYLDLRGVPAPIRSRNGPDLAKKLSYVLQRQPTLDLSKIPDTVAGDPNAKPPDTFVADTLYAGEEPVPIALKRERFADGISRWLISQKTVELIPAIDAVYGPRPIAAWMPGSLTHPTFLGNELWQWLGAVLAVFVAYAIARTLAAVLVRSASYFTHRTPTRFDDALVESARRPLRTIIWAVAFRLLLDPLQLTTPVIASCEHITYTALVAGVAWLLLRALGVSTLLLDERAARESYDLLQGRRARTQWVLLRRIASVTLGFLAGAIVLVQFDFVRSVGLSLLASAGVLGVVVGLAAQRSLAAIIGGIHFSVAQPVRMGDQVVVEGEFGEIEEINLTYIVMRLWNQRRLILPIMYFLEKPFQNWTRTSTDLVGTVVIKVDYAMPVEAVRAELRKICDADPQWDKQTCEVRAIDSDASTVTLRALVSAEDASKLWDLRCRVRERLIAFVYAQTVARSSPHTPTSPLQA
ncbi:MAG: mechanosensitive ion channel family protein [Myxococcota bacterium]|nr:mechanosensitive ion channel family protein [Myxococcota bacterium]